MKDRFLAHALPLIAASGLVLAACGADDGSGGESTSNGASVAAAFYPLAFVAERVAGEHASVENLTEPGVESHDLELTARQVGQVADADLVVHLAGYQPAVDAAIEQNASGAVLDAASTVELLPDTHEHDDEHNEDEDGHDDHEHDDHEHEEHEHDDEAHDDHGHGELDGDPHLWLDPANMAAIAADTADMLAEIDPDNADAYHANASQLSDELNELDGELASGLAQCERSLIVVSHEAFGYLTTRYGLDQLGVAGLDPDSEPSPARVSEVHSTVEAEGITTVFYERLSSPAVVESLANDLGLEIAVLDPIEGLTDETADEDYFSLMRENLEAIRAANECA
ncbi:metal ABC transporter substrate-binding protein [Phytoactinopolyspora alkaliphila]|nr:metal ABC transporter substrate-binding protein [Phytoactinopolyspora alkaliphila]